MTRARIEQPDLIGRDQDETCFIQPAPSGPAEHLQNLIGAKQLLLVIAPVRFPGEGDAAQREIDARGQSHGRHNHAQLAGFSQRLDHAGPRRVA